MIGNIKIKLAAQLMGKSEQFVRVGLQRGLLPFGTAIKMSSMWTYHISPQKFYEYMGMDFKEEVERGVNNVRDKVS